MVSAMICSGGAELSDRTPNKMTPISGSGFSPVTNKIGIGPFVLGTRSKLVLKQLQAHSAILRKIHERVINIRSKHYLHLLHNIVYIR